MKAAAFYLVLLSLALLSCDGNKYREKREKLIRVWRSSTVKNKDIDSFLIKTQKFIDTLGVGNDEAINMELYGTTNVDSLRKLLQVRLDSTKSMMANPVTNTIIEFSRDSLAFLSFNGALDTSKWTLGPDDVLTLEERKSGMQNDKVIWEVMELTDTSLVVKMKEDTSSSIVTFHPEQK